MRPVFLCILTVVACVPLAAQGRHIHLVDFECEGKPDRLVGKQNGTYFACMGGQVTCSKDRLIPQSWMDEHDAEIGRMSEKTAPLRERLQQIRRDREAGRPLTTSTPSQVRVIAAAPPPKPSGSVPAERTSLEALELGATAEAVIEEFGRPTMKLAGGAVETWTYKLTTGESAKLEFAGGKLARVNLP